mgnify:CR=1 FL=1
MTKISPLTIDPDIYKKLIYCADGKTFKPGKELIGKKISFLNSRFQILENNTSFPERISKHTYSKHNNLKNDLEKLYSSKAIHILHFKENLENIVRDGCPYCNSYHPVSEIDHYLPISDFPEYSLHSYNLIYSCDHCNGLKLNKFLDSSGSRMFIYPYFDNFINTIQFLKCDLSVNGMKLDINFYIDSSLKIRFPYEFQIVYSHFKELQLTTYYRKQALDPLLSSLRSTWTSINPTTNNPEWDNLTLSELQTSITFKLKEFQYFNLNRWEIVFLNSLKNCTNYLNLIVNKTLPVN